MILRKISQSSVLLLLIPFLFWSQRAVETVHATEKSCCSERPARQDYDPYTLIAEVNALRAANGLDPLTPDPILMGVSQRHAEYMASTGSVTHYSADGSRPFQRSLAAGYPVAGDLTLGGFHSENIIAGTNMTPAEAVSWWTGDDPHLNTMLSPSYRDIGAGVAIVGNKIYYVIDTSRKSGSSAIAYTPPAVNGTPVYNLGPLISTIYPNTPAADGSILHVVKPGETLWLIAITYGTKVDEILRMNNLPQNSPIYPGQQLLIREVTETLTPTAPQPEQAPTQVATTTIPLTRTPTIIAVHIDEGEESTSSQPGSWMIPAIIVIGALVVSGVIARSAGRRKRV